LASINIDDKNAPLAINYNWFFVDIVGASDPSIPVLEQANKIKRLNNFVEKTKIFTESDNESRVTLSTGDGMVMGFKDHPEKPILLAIELHDSILNYNESVIDKDKINIRIGIDSGPVYFVADLEKKLSPWGPGIINARRAMDIGEKMHILATSRIADDISKLTPEYAKMLHPIGDYGIKHGPRLFLYNIYGNRFGNESKPPDTETDLSPMRTFYFTNIEVRNEVIDPRIMMVHHTWVWELINVRQEPVDQVFYYLDGDIARRFGDLNVKVTDEKGNKLEISAMNVNEDRRKEFIVKTKTPLMPNQTGRSLKLEYDWEEPKRVFFYRFSSKCKEFKYLFTAPEEVIAKPRVLQVEPELGLKMHPKEPPLISFNNNKTEMTWQKSDLQVFDAYEFQW